MTITRTINGERVEITLTEEEVFQAHLEQEYLNDREDCRAYLDDESEFEDNRVDALLEQYDGDMDAIVDDMVQELHDILTYHGDGISRADAIEQAFDRLL